MEVIGLQLHAQEHTQVRDAREMPGGFRARM